MNLPQLENLVKVDDDVTNDNYGHYPDRRPIESLLYYGLVLVDKPAGPTSHEVVAWVKRILEIEKAGHSGTLDPGATGLLPVGLGEGTKALSVLLLGPKEYYALARFHSHISPDKLKKVIHEFTGKIYQRPPQRSSVRRVTRVRTVYEFDYLENYDRLVLMRILCQAGTYIRKIIYDIGEVLSSGATMVELRRTRVSNLSEQAGGLVRLHDLTDAYQRYKESKDDEKLRRLWNDICSDGSLFYVVVEEDGEARRVRVVARDPALAPLCGEIERLTLDRSRPRFAQAILERRESLLMSTITDAQLEALGQGRLDVGVLRTTRELDGGLQRDTLCGGLCGGDLCKRHQKTRNDSRMRFAQSICHGVVLRAERRGARTTGPRRDLPAGRRGRALRERPPRPGGPLARRVRGHDRAARRLAGRGAHVRGRHRAGRGAAARGRARRRRGLCHGHD